MYVTYNIIKGQLNYKSKQHTSVSSGEGFNSIINKGKKCEKM